jgi:hypothetical protein
VSDFNNILDDVLAELAGAEEGVEETETELNTDEVDELETEDEGAEPDSDDEETEDEDEDGEDDDDEDADVIDLDPEMTVRIDGKEVLVKDALELKADYTRKTQALAEERKAIEEEKAQYQGQLTYLQQMEEVWTENPAHLLATFAASTEEAEDLLAETVVALASAGAADGNLALVKLAISLAGNDLLSDELAEQMGFTDDVVARIKRQAQSEQRVARVERRLAAEDRKQSEASEKAQSDAAFEAQVQQHLAELNSQWERIISANPEVASMSDAERHELRITLVKYAQENDGVPLHVAYDALEAKRLRGDQAKRAASAATRQKKAKGTRVSSKPSTSGGSPAPRQKGDWDAAIAEAMAELEAKNRTK